MPSHAKAEEVPTAKKKKRKTMFKMPMALLSGCVLKDDAGQNLCFDFSLGMCVAGH